MEGIRSGSSLLQGGLLQLGVLGSQGVVVSDCLVYLGDGQRAVGSLKGGSRKLGGYACIYNAVVVLFFLVLVQQSIVIDGILFLDYCFFSLIQYFLASIFHHTLLLRTSPIIRNNPIDFLQALCFILIINPNNNNLFIHNPFSEFLAFILQTRILTKCVNSSQNISLSKKFSLILSIQKIVYLIDIDFFFKHQIFIAPILQFLLAHSFQFLTILLQPMYQFLPWIDDNIGKRYNFLQRKLKIILKAILKRHIDFSLICYNFFLSCLFIDNFFLFYLKTLQRLHLLTPIQLLQLSYFYQESIYK